MITVIWESLLETAKIVGVSLVLTNAIAIGVIGTIFSKKYKKAILLKQEALK